MEEIRSPQLAHLERVAEVRLDGLAGFDVRGHLEDAEVGTHLLAGFDEELAVAVDE